MHKTCICFKQEEFDDFLHGQITVNEKTPKAEVIYTKILSWIF